MAYDVPVLISRQSGVAEVVRNAIKADFWDVREMANKIAPCWPIPCWPPRKSAIAVKN